MSCPLLLCCEERLREWGLLRVEKRFQGELIVAVQNLMGAPGKLGRDCSQRAGVPGQGDGSDPTDSRVTLDMNRKFSPVRVVRLGQRLSREGGKCLEVFGAGAWSKTEWGSERCPCTRRSAVRSLLTPTIP